MIGAGVTKIINDIELANSPNYGMGVTNINCSNNENIYSFYNPAYEWNCDKKYSSLISDKNINMVSNKITELLQGIHPEGKKIVVPHDTIKHVISSKFKLFQSFDISKINEETISYIVGYVSSEFQSIKNNQNYSAWTTLLGSQNEHGLMPNPKIKLRERRPNSIMMWNY